jgi:hypothetical protein
MSIEATLSSMEYTIQAQEDYIGKLETLLELALNTNITNGELKEKLNEMKGIEEEEQDIDDLPFV